MEKEKKVTRKVTRELNKSIESGMIPAPNKERELKYQLLMKEFGIKFEGDSTSSAS